MSDLIENYSLIDHDVVMTPNPNQYVLRVKDLPDSARPRERLTEFGPKALSTSELLAVIWGVGTRKEEVLGMAKRTLKEYGEKAINHETNPVRLAESADIPLAKACQLVASFEIGRRYYAVHAGRPVQVRTARQAYWYLKSIANHQKEQLRGIYLNARYQVIHDEIISIGTLTSNIVHPREVFQPAIEHGAVAVIIAHNHPSGRLEPTAADIAVTEQLFAGGKLLGIELLDHLVIAGTKYTSVMEALDND